MDQQTMTSDHRPLTLSSSTRPVIDADVDAGPTWRGRLRAVWNAIVGGIGLVVGLVPHLLHHVTLLAGTALVAGSGGTALFGVLGLLASIPLLLRLYRRFGTWRAPAIGLMIFAAMFSVSTFVVGPAISGAGGAGSGSGPVPSVDHTVHHDGDPTPTAT
ncbi:MAG: hypothetical protein ABIP19_00975 [Dermatophilaceae bacterium]